MTNEKNLSRKERERLFRRGEILDAALSLFAKKGFRSTTLDEIAEAAEFGKGTIYNYFDNKEDIYNAIMEKITGYYLTTLKEADEESKSLFDFFNKFIRTHLLYCVDNREAFLLLVNVRMHDEVHTRLHHGNLYANNYSSKMKNYQNEIRNIYERRISESIKNGEIEDIDTRKLITIARGVVFNYILELLDKTDFDKTDVDKETDFLTNVLFNGIFKK